MYQHILVPIDDSELSMDVVGNASALAKSVGARITFFHVVADHAGSLLGDAEVLRALSPQDHAYGVTGKARELLSKAQAAARAAGVVGESLQVVSNRPAQAIMDAARHLQCDLIFMASHGRRSRLGMALASTTLGVLMSADMPVLVSSMGTVKASVRAIGIIRDEHRSIAAVLHAWMHALAAACAQGSAADPVLMKAMLRYVQAFPLALHHPKEDEYVFKRLRERTRELDADLDELSSQHLRDHALVDGLSQRVNALTIATGDAAVEATADLHAAVTTYASFLWEHMGREENVVLPAAGRHLTDADWEGIEAAFSENKDPRFSGDVQREYRQLFSRIVNEAQGWK